MTRARRAAAAALFLTIACGLFFLCQRVLVRKSLAGAWDMTNKIAGIYKVTVAQLVKWNNIANPNLIRVGQVLRVK